jgi:hypothetical protein
MPPQTRSKLKRSTPVQTTSAPKPPSNINVVPNSTSQVHVQSEQSNPLRDITDQFLPPAFSSPKPYAPAPNHRKRRTKVPSTVAKLKLAQDAVQTRRSPIQLTSPLPPSSPPSASSHDCGDVHFDTENIPPTTTSDPFGFLAVERKLKAARDKGDDTFDSYSFDDDLYLDDDLENDASVVIFPTPLPLAHNMWRAGNGFKGGTATMTPHKRQHDHKRFVSPAGSSLHTSSIPSTPSPSKPTQVPDSPRDVGLLDPVSRQEDDSDLEEVPKPKEKKRGKTQRDPKPREIVRNLEALLPKGSKRGATRKVAEEKKSDDEVPVKTRKSRRTAVKGKMKPKTKTRKNKEDGGKLIEPELEEDEVRPFSIRKSLNSC